LRVVPIQITAYLISSGSDLHLRDAIESLLLQRDAAELDILVIDRDSTGRTSEVVESFRESRIERLQVPPSASIACCHNLAVARSKSPLIAHVEPSGMVLPGAFRKIADRLKAAPDAGLVHGYSFRVSTSGATTRDAFRRRRAFLLQTRRPGMDYRWALLFSENEIDPFRVYSRRALEATGPFNESLGAWAGYDLALRIADRFPIELVPEMLYAFRAGDNPRPPSRLTSVTNCFRRFFCCRALQNGGQVSFLAPRECNLTQALLQGIWRSLRMEGVESGFSRAGNYLKTFRSNFYWKGILPATDRFYLRFAGRLPWWPINLFQTRSAPPREGAGRIAYYTWRFPILSQTFIHRELAALKRSGISLLVLADEPDDIAMADENARGLLRHTEYLNQIDEKRLAEYKRYFFRRNPFQYLNLFLYLMTRQYRGKKNFLEDLFTFSRVVALAGLLKDKEVDHVHTPWADQTALIALLASRLLGITYSVQARAHDIHRKSYLFGLKDKLANAEFVVTNTAYNRDYLCALLGDGKKDKVQLIHNGLDLHRFPQPLQRRKPDFQVHKILCVGRLIEQKGLTCLLRACRILLDRGVDLTCEIVGAPEEPEYTNYYLELKLLHRNLGLGDRVVFAGALPFASVLGKYAEADLFVLPCVLAEDGSRDITPNALIEAMAMGRCVVSTPVTGVPEIVEDGVSGLLVPPGDADALAGAIAALLHDPEARRGMGQNARKRVEQKFDVNRNIARYVELFSGVGIRESIAPEVAPEADRAVV
jgi:glycosyltransferase involved in cell wall biosynthesis